MIHTISKPKEPPTMIPKVNHIEFCCIRQKSMFRNEANEESVRPMFAALFGGE